jgi:hypothetical protein
MMYAKVEGIPAPVLREWAKLNSSSRLEDPEMRKEISFPLETIEVTVEAMVAAMVEA